MYRLDPFALSQYSYCTCPSCVCYSTTRQMMETPYAEVTPAAEPSDHRWRFCPKSRELPWLIIVLQFILIVALLISMFTYIVSSPLEVSLSIPYTHKENNDYQLQPEMFSSTMTLDSVDVKNLPTPANFHKIVKTTSEANTAIPEIEMPIYEKSSESPWDFETLEEVKDKVDGKEATSGVESEPFKAAVYTENAICSDVGRSILVRGGNAVDAAIGATFCMTAVHPHTASIGGGVILLIRHQQGTTAVTARETAPSASNARYFARHRDELEQGAKASGVPGVVHGLFRAYEKFSSRRLSWKQIIALSVHVCTRGFAVSESLATALRSIAADILADEATRRMFANTLTNETLKAGELIACHSLAATLSDIAEYEDPIDYFYRGEIAERLVSEIQNKKGILGTSDFEDFESDVSEAMCASVDVEHVLCGPGPPSTFAALVPATAASRNSSEADSVEELSWSMAQMIADPVFHPPTRNLARSLLETNAIQRIRKLEKKQSRPRRAERGSSTVMVVDENGMSTVVSISIGDLFGNKQYSQLGFFMNNQLDSFSLAEHSPNALQPGKAPATTLAPMFVVRNRNNETISMTAGSDFGGLLKSVRSVVFGSPPTAAEGATPVLRLRNGSVSLQFASRDLLTGY